MKSGGGHDTRALVLVAPSTSQPRGLGSDTTYVAIQGCDPAGAVPTRMVRAGWVEVLVYHGNRTPLLSVLRADAGYAEAHRLWVCGPSATGMFTTPEIERADATVNWSPGESRGSSGVGL